MSTEVLQDHRPEGKNFERPYITMKQNETTLNNSGTRQIWPIYSFLLQECPKNVKRPFYFGRSGETPENDAVKIHYDGRI